MDPSERHEQEHGDAAGATRTERAIATRARPRQEPDHVPVRGILWVFALCIVTAAVSIVWGAWESRPPPGPARSLPEAVALPVPERVGRVHQDLIPAPSGERSVDRARQRLETYGWTDRDRGLVRIPIARAIELRVAERGDAAGEAP